jgi:hypothetical protein
MRGKWFHVVIGGIVAAGMWPVAGVGAESTSNTFTMHYGRVPVDSPPNAGGWTTDETAGVNQDVTGDFSLTITFPPDFPAPGNQTPSFSAFGPTFEDAVLGEGTDLAHTGRSDLFAVEIEGAYTGSKPVTDVKLVITSISIYGARHAAAPGGEGLTWKETTPGNEAASSLLPLNEVPNSSELTNPFNFTQAAWDPADPTTPGTRATRSFNLQSDGGHRAIDGFTVTGHIEAIHDTSD